MQDVTIRLMLATDAAAVSGFLPDLGYTAEPIVLAQRFAALMQWPGEHVLVAELLGKVIGLCHVQAVRRLDSDGYGEVVTLVVKAEHQRCGIGRLLVDAATSWVFANGFNRVRLGSGVHREGAHRFYEALGFTRNRPGYVFELRQINSYASV